MGSLLPEGLTAAKSSVDTQFCKTYGQFMPVVEVEASHYIYVCFRGCSVVDYGD